MISFDREGRVVVRLNAEVDLRWPRWKEKMHLILDVNRVGQRIPAEVAGVVMMEGFCPDCPMKAECEKANAAIINRCKELFGQMPPEIKKAAWLTFEVFVIGCWKEGILTQEEYCSIMSEMLCPRCDEKGCPARAEIEKMMGGGTA